MVESLIVYYLELQLALSFINLYIESASLSSAGTMVMNQTELFSQAFRSQSKFDRFTSVF